VSARLRGRNLIGAGRHPVERGRYRGAVTGRPWRIRLVALAAASAFIAVALGIRVLASSGGILDSSGAIAQYSGTALYASVVYAGVFVVAPSTRPSLAAAVAIFFCWLVEFLQLTGVPAELSQRSMLARLVLGVQFDAVDLPWYAVGVLPLAVLHRAAARNGASTVDNSP